MNTDLLLKRIKESGLSNKEISESANITRKTLYNAQYGIGNTSLRVIQNIAYTLKLSKDDVGNIFFSEL